MAKPHFRTVKYGFEYKPKGKKNAHLPWIEYVPETSWYRTTYRPDAVARLKELMADKKCIHKFRLVRAEETRTVEKP